MTKWATAFTMLLFLVLPSWAAEPTVTIRGRVLDVAGTPIPSAGLAVILKTWRDGYRQSALEARADAHGEFLLEDVCSATGRYAVLVTALSDGHVMQSVYLFRQSGGPLAPITFHLPAADPVTVRFLDASGGPVAGVSAFPLSRRTKDGKEYSLYRESATTLARASDEKGTVSFALFAKGDEVKLHLRFPGGSWEDRSFPVRGTAGEVVTITSGTPTVEAAPPAEPAPGALLAGGDARKRYFLLGPRSDEAAPPAGYGLLLVLPGGDGSESFRPFVQRIFEHAVPAGFLQAELVAVRWQKDQQVVWPTAKARTPGMAFATEDFIAAVVKDVASKHKLDPGRVFTLSWSSSGPACYAASLAEGSPVRGSFVAMSVFRPDALPPLDLARGKAYLLLHSPADTVCPYSMAEAARDALTKAGARTNLVTYDGGHGWRGDVYGQIRQGLLWLVRNVQASR